MVMNPLPISNVAARSAPQSTAHSTTYPRLLRFAQSFLTYQRVARQRRQLRKLDESALKDIGIERTDALREANRSFWDIPERLKHRR